MDSRLLVVPDGDFDLGRFGEVLGERIDLTHAEFDVSRVGGRATFDDPQMDSTLVVGDRSVDLCHGCREWCVGGEDVVRDACLCGGVSNENAQSASGRAVLFELLQSCSRSRVED